MNFPKPDEWEPGIYFGLDEELYHSLPWLGSSDMKDLFSAPQEYWWNSAMNPLRPSDDATPAKRFGTALHHCILYGRESFDRRYRKLPGDGDEPSAEDLKLYIAAQGCRIGKTKAENFRICWEQMRTIPLSERRYGEVVLSAQMIKKNPHLIPAFENGWPEVSIFWRNEDGIPMKCRIDYLKQRASVDIKSFSGKNRIMPLDRMILSDIVRYRYDIQVAHYQEGRQAARGLGQAGRIFGEIPDGDGLARALVAEEPGWVWVFYRSDGPPIAKSFQARWGSPMHESGRAGVTQAISNYLACKQKFGTDFWVNDDPPYDIEEDDLPKWL